MPKEDPNNNKMTVEKIEGGMIQIRKDFRELRSDNVDETEVMFEFNAAMYKLEQRFSNLRKVFY